MLGECCEMELPPMYQGLSRGKGRSAPRTPQENAPEKDCDKETADRGRDCYNDYGCMTKTVAC